ncbi:MAG: hypothetical protein G01um1014106_665 [Parcubacteria group bacterium Gr01-1014_106]|nr:MAG: hypothetical protein G01um1014106_665 [Parcubacteria group bacterium Gr01-1014_106]
MRFPVSGIALLVGVGVPLAGLLFGPAIGITVAALGVGAALALLFIPEMSVLLWIGTSLSFGTGTLLLHALVRAVFPVLGSISFATSFGMFCAVLGVMSALLLWRFRFARTILPFVRADIAFLGVALVMFGSIAAVNSRNGYVPLADGNEEFHARGFVNGDTMTLFALTKATESRGQGTGLLRENPFAGNGPLEYPTLLHRALADIMTATGGDITRDAWWLMIPVLIGTAAVGALLVQLLIKREHVPWWAGVIFFAALAATWESFTYPQSHTFLTGLLFLLVGLLVLRDQTGNAAERRMLRWGIGLLAIVLLFSNAVLGTAAVAIAVGSNALQCFNRGWPLRDRVSGLIGSAILLFLFFRFLRFGHCGTQSGCIARRHCLAQQYHCRCLPL